MDEATPPLFAFGDSITYGYPVGAADAYPAAVAASLGRTLVNRAISGAGAADQADAIYEQSPAAGSLATYMIGVNDADRGNGNDDLPDDVAFFTRCLMAQAAWLAIDSGEIVRGTDPRFSYTGEWADTPRFSLGRNSGEPGAAFEVELEGDTLYVAFIQFYGTLQASAPSSCVLRVDGQACAVFQTSSGARNDSSIDRPSSYQAPALVRIGGLGPGVHTLSGQLLPGSSGPLFVDWAWGNGAMAKDGADGPRLLLGLPTRLTPAAYLAQKGSLDATQLYGAAVRRVATRLAGDGHDVGLVDTYSALDDLDADLGPDGVHPTIEGQQKLAKAFIAAAPGTPG